MGKLRFGRPEPPELPWEGVRDCSRNANICVQQAIKTEWMTMHRGYEDCLTLNVYVPKTEEDEKVRLRVNIL